MDLVSPARSFSIALLISFANTLFMWVYHRGVEQTITNYKFLYKVTDVQQGFSKGEDAGEGLVGEEAKRRRGLATLGT
jgi:hypothetical protein